ncbi:MAG TPA: SDR family oxidoreductase [Anaerohalosphaeraceae bacterium]|nr:SDR family oxidoreductase [Anaerohalosphaeraceae bacterium]HOL31438.1 SDR family oxidoreductase [Anaerohalosphaeraceae bacterium]HOM76351.1 SDR family oxidoreductase [Anaerohalosphaeraceae bacterium]HPC63296.1 SDR family oxidoreductase [Anaerohalosphaeraceae bacterium]HPO68998.1 SDR family oxidoreductase [Anaerohalosphaeraceae bacterium]
MALNKQNTIWDFSGKTAIVTGGGQGIGLCIAQMFLQSGANAVIADSNADLKSKAHVFLNAPENLLFSVTDVADENAVITMTENALQRFGRIDFLVNNAAAFCDAPLDTLTCRQWQTVLHVNLTGAFLCSKYCRPQLEKNRGAIVNIASTRALMSQPDTLIAYSASKGGLVALTHALANTLGPAVRVNCISPGWIVTDAYQHGGRRTKLTQADSSQHPAGRVGRPEDIAEMVLYLCSDKAGFITGQNIVIDGGMTIKMIYV